MDGKNQSKFSAAKMKLLELVSDCDRLLSYLFIKKFNEEKVVATVLMHGLQNEINVLLNN